MQWVELGPPRRGSCSQVASSSFTNGWMAEWSKAADSRYSSLRTRVYSVLVRGARSNRAPVNSFCIFLLGVPFYASDSDTFKR